MYEERCKSCSLMMQEKCFGHGSGTGDSVIKKLGRGNQPQWPKNRIIVDNRQSIYAIIISVAAKELQYRARNLNALKSYRLHSSGQNENCTGETESGTNRRILNHGGSK